MRVAQGFKQLRSRWSGFADRQYTLSTFAYLDMADALWNDQRKLRPVYEAIDARNYKQALKLTSSLLEKKPTACILKVPVAQRAPRSERSE